MIVTIFNAKKIIQKVPISPFGDKTFIFESHAIPDKDALFRTAVSHCILNIPLNLTAPIRSLRRKTSLDSYYPEYVDYVVIDADHVNSAQNRSAILEFFKDYDCIIGESRGSNNTSNFNLKGFLMLDHVRLSDLKFVVLDLHDRLKDFCELDGAVSRKVSFNAPIEKYKVLLNSDGKKYVYSGYNPTPKNDAALKPVVKGEIKADSVEDYCLRYFQNMGFEAMSTGSDGSIRFKHPSEVKTPGGYFWYSTTPYTMHHFNVAKTLNIYDQVIKNSDFKDIIKKSINYDDALLKFTIGTKVITVSEKYLKVTDEIYSAISEFLSTEGGLFTIRSPMGTGKSTIIAKIIEESHEQDLRVLIITNRISVAEDFSKKYHLKVYNQGNYRIGESLICQFDSLRKYDLKFFDVVIMDEFVSLMLHSRTAINANTINTAKFFSAFNKKLVIADAFLTGYEGFLLDTKLYNLHMLNNEYRDPTAIKLYENLNYFNFKLLETARKEQITVSVTSLSYGYSLKKMLESNNIKTIFLTAETDDIVKNLIYRKFEKSDNDSWRVLIFSPTLTVGVSNLNHTLHHFHYDSASTTNVISSIQMIKRTRKTSEIHLYIKSRLNPLQTSYEQLRNDALSGAGTMVNTSCLFELNAYGEPKLSSIGSKCLQIDRFANILEFNHRDAFIYMMKYHFLNAPEIVTQKFTENILGVYHREYLSEKTDKVKDDVEQYIALQGTAYDEFKDVRNNRLLSIDSQLVTVAENPAFDINTRKTILVTALQDEGFIRKCRFYNALYDYSRRLITSSDIQAVITKIMTSERTRTDEIPVYMSILKCKEKNLQDTYAISYVQKQKFFESLLQKCGYMVYNSDVKRIGERCFEISREVKKYSRFVKP